MLKPESALIIRVPAAEPLVGVFRGLYDPDAAIGVPAHITILYPFKTPGALDRRVRDDLRQLFQHFSVFRFTLTAVRRFDDDVLYLAPQPAEPFRQLTQAVAAYSPETPPYGGEFSEIVPHLTIARPSADRGLAEIAAEFDAAAVGRLPIRARASKVTLMDTQTGRWEIRDSFPLAR